MIKFLIKLQEFFIVMINPKFWIQLYDDYPYSEPFEVWCRQSLKEGHIPKLLNKHEVIFNGRTLWFGNGKTCCFNLHEQGYPEISLSRYTKIKMWNKLMGEAFKISSKGVDNE